MSSTNKNSTTDNNNNLTKKVVQYEAEVGKQISDHDVNILTEKLEKFLETFETKNGKGEKIYKYVQKLVGREEFIAYLPHIYSKK
jgi:GH25 family lysozyme M1 (1,4-beta-N-acetylmuramidase)